MTAQGTLARRIAPALVAALLPVALARGGEPARAPASPGPNPDEELRRVTEVVGTIRGRRFSRPIPARSVPCALASVRLLEIARLEGARGSPDVERAARTLGFIAGEPGPAAPDDGSPPAAPRPGSRSAGREDDDGAHPCGLAFYDQIRKEVVVVDGRAGSDERGEVLAHELSHALQDELFDLRARLRVVPRTASGDHDAEELAVNAALNEGEATAVELLYLWRKGGDRSWIQGVRLDDRLESALAIPGLLAPSRARRLAAGMRAVARGAGAGWTEQLRLGARSYFHALGRFQYLAGAAFVAEAFRRGGWEGVDRLRAGPPSSTSQLLHPERYFDRVGSAVRVGPTDFLASRGARYRLLYENRLGELGCLVASEGDASGWQGDLYRVIARADGTSLVEARSLWEDPESALRFAGRSARWLRSMRLSAGSFDVLERRGRAVALGGGLRQDELPEWRDAAWRPRPGDAVAEAAASTRADRRALGLRLRGEDGAALCELRLLAADERPPALDILNAHVDRTAVATDGRTWGYRRRPAGGVSYVEERPGGRIVVATAADRSSVEESLAALARLAPVEPAATTSATGSELGARLVAPREP